MFSLGLQLNKLSEGTLEGYRYRLMVSQPRLDNLPDPRDSENFAAGNDFGAALGQAVANAHTALLAGRMILILDLPYKSPVHVAGFGLQDKTFKEALNNTAVDNAMTKVELEGDFPDYFVLYCDPEHQIELRQILDPATMAFLVDYCQRLQWEVFENCIYFAELDKSEAGDADTTTAVDDALTFVKRVLPVLQRIKQA